MRIVLIGVWILIVGLSGCSSGSSSGAENAGATAVSSSGASEPASSVTAATSPSSRSTTATTAPATTAGPVTTTPSTTVSTPIAVSEPGSTTQPPAATSVIFPNTSGQLLSIAAWGDSLTAGSGGIPYPTELERLLPGRTIFNGGAAGQNSTQIVARQGAIPLRVTLVGDAIPPTGWADVRTLSSDVVDNMNFGPVYGTLNGQYGYLTRSPNGYAAGFYRDTDGPAILVAPATVFQVDTLGRDRWVNLIWIGRNGFLNADLARLYPDNFLDIRRLLVEQADVSRPDDRATLAADVPAQSLGVDNLPLNTRGYAFVAAQVATFIVNKGW